jgi:hypothetical protein
VIAFAWSSTVVTHDELVSFLGDLLNPTPGMYVSTFESAGLPKVADIDLVGGPSQTVSITNGSPLQGTFGDPFVVLTFYGGTTPAIKDVAGLQSAQLASGSSADMSQNTTMTFALSGKPFVESRVIYASQPAADNSQFCATNALPTPSCTDFMTIEGLVSGCYSPAFNEY